MQHDETSRAYRTYGTSRAVRHSLADYAADLNIHVVIAAWTGRPFDDAELARQTCQSAEVVCRQLGYRLYGYCLMPDRFHVLLSPGMSGVKLKTWLQRFKSFTGHWAKRHRGIDGLWQRSCYDHICREGETAERVLRYIMDNPVRGGSVTDWQAWPRSKAFIEV